MSLREVIVVVQYHGCGLAIIDPADSTRQQVVALPSKAISVGYHPASGTALLSTHAHCLCLVDTRDGRLVRSIPTRSDPDPVAVIPLAGG